MELDFIDNVNEYGENVVRLYNFDQAEAIKFRNLIVDQIIIKNQRLNLSEIDFIYTRNCNLILGLFSTDEGIISTDNETFYCALTIEGYTTMVKLLEPYCEKETRGYKYLYDIDNPTDFLFSPAGSSNF